MSKKKKKKNKKVKPKKYTPKVSKDERIKQINQIQPPELDRKFIKENDEGAERWRPMWRNDWKSIAEKKRLTKRHNRPKQPKKKVF